MSADRFAFGPFEFDPRRCQLTRGGEATALGSRQCDLLHVLVARAGELLSKEQLIAAAWPDVAVTDNSLEQAISGLRRILDKSTGTAYIETVPRRGYRFAAPVGRIARRESDDGLEALLAPHRAWLDGRAALETLERSQIQRARGVFERVLASAPGQATAHVGLANACAMQFEMTRADDPDGDALAEAARHAREACRLEPEYGEAWATLGFVLERTGDRGTALASLRRAVMLEPDNWRHHVRLAYGSWGEERLRAARRALALLPGFPLAHWLAATVYIARQALGEAERELEAGLAAPPHDTAQSRFSGVALHWLLGLVRLSAGDEAAAVDHFARELADESSGHLYARECCANTWYALGAVHYRAGRTDEARTAFREALERVRRHPLARMALAAIDRRPGDEPLFNEAPASTELPAFEAALSRAVAIVLSGAEPDAATVIERALIAAPAGNAGWLLPVEPMLRVNAAPTLWAPALARLRSRAA